MLSLCMIVKNEELNLESCLKKAAPFVDEIVIVDTGSTDKTKIIAAKFTDKIYDFKWCYDFAEARNYSILKATNDWVLVLDADEFITCFNKDLINIFINNSLNELKVGRIERTNIMGDTLEVKKYTEWGNRFFNRKYFYYKGIVHEQVTSKNEDGYETECLDIKVEHVGYTKEVLDRTNKIKRNIDMLKSAVSINSEDPYLYFQLGKSYYLLKDYKSAALYFEKALFFDLDYHLEYVNDLVETYGYSLINSGRYSEALILENVSEIYDNSPDFLFLMGLIYMNNAMFKNAIESFLKCTKFAHGKVEGVNSFSAYYNAGIIYEMLGIKEKSVECYKMCGDYPPALKRLNIKGET